MPRIRQYAERDATKDFLAEIRAQSSRYNYRSQEALGEAIGVSQMTVSNYLKDPGNMKFSTLKSMIKLLHLDPIIVLKALGYSAAEIRKIQTKEINQ